ncbi:ABC transporter permease subunit [Paenibacillus sp. PFR10]|uniref:ABC transporter permease subunit n=2 Tax=Paenibacillus TaxID=44249 RepID=A0ABU3RCM9_9BACL|nr:MULTISPECIES: ABC transporter permease subunit [Paenibacillus]MDU0202012.1 ABC transporter permease subunit [Paenibacillus sp. PFR10]MEC0266794.1 ABC transporter permease subunit [Paenibacillus anseongense]
MQAMNSSVALDKKESVVIPQQKKKGLSYYIRLDYMLYLMLLVPIAYIVIFKYAPMYGIQIAFKDYNIFQGVSKSPWNNFETFKQIFASPQFFQVVRNTLMLNFLDLILGFPAPIILAILLNELVWNKFKKVSQTILYLPHFLSWVIIGGIVTQLLSPTGMLNSLIGHMGGQSLPFLTNKYVWVATYSLIGVWQNAGWGTILYLAAMTGIDKQLYEAADADGAGRLRKIWHITLPGIRPTIAILLILQLGNIMAINFDRPFNIQNNLVMDYGDVISTYVYRVGIQSANFSIGAAVGLFQSVICLIFLVTSNFISRKLGENGIW